MESMNYKFSINRILFWGIFLLVISTQGILTFNIFKLLGGDLWTLKSFVQPFAVSIILFYFLLKLIGSKKIKLTQIDILLFAYFGFSVVFLIQNFSGFESVYIAFREVYLLFILIFIFNQVQVTYKQWNVILNLIFILVLLNIVFTILIFFMDWSQYTKLLVGESF